MSIQQQAVTPAFATKGLSKRVTILTFLAGIFMGALDHGIVGPALSSILQEFSIAASWGVWSFTIYTLLFAVSIPILGKLSDRFGRKQTFMFGIAMFGAGSLIAAIAPNFTTFLIGRALQAVGTGGIFPITAAQIAVSYPPEKRGRMLGMIGVFFGIGTILGPVLGAVIITYMNWQWVFLINIPISILILIFISALRQEQPVVKKRIDIAGISLLTATILLVMLGITNKNFLMLLVGILIIPVLIAVERKQADPILNVNYFRNRHIVVFLVTSLISGFVMASATNLIPYFAETVLGMDKGQAGISVTPLAIASMLASLIGGILVDRMGAKKVLTSGFFLTLFAGAVMASFVDTAWMLYPTILVMGFGIGIIIGAPLNVLMLQAVDVKETGTAIGYLSLFRSLGSTMGPTVAGLLLAMSDNGFALLFTASALLSGFSVVLLLMFITGKPTNKGV